MSDDETELPFTLFIAVAQLIVGIGLIAFASSSAVRIIGVVVIAFALLTGGTAWYQARRRGQRLFVFAEATDEASADEERADPEGAQESTDQFSQGPRQPPNPATSRRASGGPHEPGG